MKNFAITTVIAATLFSTSALAQKSLSSYQYQNLELQRQQLELQQQQMRQQQKQYEEQQRQQLQMQRDMQDQQFNAQAQAQGRSERMVNGYYVGGSRW